MTGVELIAQERERQKSVEGWTDEHDNAHTNDELARAAACYALPCRCRGTNPIGVPRHWPMSWFNRWWKPTPLDRVRELVKAGALIAAEIDRLQREAQP